MPYRDSVACCVFNSKGKVFVGKRKSGKAGGKGNIWQFPQGGIDIGEDPLEAAKRELYEETSIHSISLITAISEWTYYDIPDAALGVALKGKFRGQRQKWFAFLFEGADDEINVKEPANGKHSPEFDDWRWEKLKNTPELVVPFKKKVYLQVVDSFGDIPKQLTAKALKKKAKIKRLKEKNIALWVELRRALWPKFSRKKHSLECERLLNDKRQAAFGLFDDDNLVGFIQVREREIGDGLNSSPIAWLEGIYLKQNYRQKGFGKKLLLKIEKWAKKRNLSELRSDAKMENKNSISAHKSWGFTQANKIVQFKKQLK